MLVGITRNNLLKKIKIFLDSFFLSFKIKNSAGALFMQGNGLGAAEGVLI